MISTTAAVVIASTVLTSPLFASMEDLERQVKQTYGENTAVMITEGNNAYSMAQELRNILGEGGTIKALISCDSLLPNQGHSIVHTTAHELQFAGLKLEQAIVLTGIFPHEHKTADEQMNDLKTKTKVTKTDHTTFSWEIALNASETVTTIPELKILTIDAKSPVSNTIDALNQTEAQPCLIQFNGQPDELQTTVKSLLDDVKNTALIQGVFFKTKKDKVNAKTEYTKVFKKGLPGFAVTKKGDIVTINEFDAETLKQVEKTLVA